MFRFLLSLQKGSTTPHSSRWWNLILELMGHLSSMFNGLTRSFSLKKGRKSGDCSGSEAAEVMAKEAKKNDLILRSSGFVNSDASDNLASVFSKRGKKGVNQDCCIVWEVCSEQLRIAYAPSLIA